jgi:hypothetical protein
MMESREDTSGACGFTAGGGSGAEPPAARDSETISSRSHGSRCLTGPNQRIECRNFFLAYNGQDRFLCHSNHSGSCHFPFHASLPPVPPALAGASAT